MPGPNDPAVTMTNEGPSFRQVRRLGQRLDHSQGDRWPCPLQTATARLRVTTFLLALGSDQGFVVATEQRIAHGTLLPGVGPRTNDYAAFRHAG